MGKKEGGKLMREKGERRKGNVRQWWRKGNAERKRVDNS